MPIPLPTAEEINIYDSLDEQCAVRNFLGKDMDQAQALFRENLLYYQEDLMWMGPVAFCFYVQAAMNYLRSTDSDGDYAGASSLCSCIDFQLEHYAPAIAPAAPAIRAGLIAIFARLDRFDHDRQLDGDLAQRYNALLARM